MPGELLAKVIVADTGPLITLAVGNSLDYLLYPNVPVIVPDAVLYEATRDAHALGAAEILDWVQRNSDRIQTVATEAFFNFVESAERNPGRREKDLGERAALEAIHDAVHLAADERAVLLTEDDRVLRQVLVLQTELTATIIPITTRDFLVAMEDAHRINSADDVYRLVEDSGRSASQREILASQHRAAREAVARAVRGAQSKKE